MKRRNFIKTVPTILLAGLGTAGTRLLAGPESTNSRFRIAVLNDLHHDSPDCDAWFRGVAETVSALSPDVCVLAGDLANKGLESSLVSVRKIFSGIGCPVNAVPGNHDCDVTDDTSLYERIFPNQLNYTVRQAGWQLVFLDTTDGKAWKDIRISERTLDWLAETVPHLDKEAPTLVFSHFPLASSIHMAPLNVNAVWELLRPLSIKAAFCGHFHGQHSVIRPPLVTTNICCARPGVRGNFDGDPRKGFWIIDADAATGRLDYRVKLLGT